MSTDATYALETLAYGLMALGLLATIIVTPFAFAALAIFNWLKSLAGFEPAVAA